MNGPGNIRANRSELVTLASPVADHLLLLDADQTVTGFLPVLDQDAYRLPLKMGRLEWMNLLLIRSALPWAYEGVTHEFLTCPTARPAVPLTTLTIIEHSDGGGRPLGTQPRWEWDAEILEQELAKDPANPRYASTSAACARTSPTRGRTIPRPPNGGRKPWNGIAGERP